LIIGLLLTAFSAAGVWAIHSLGPWILLRDQTASSWHHLETGWALVAESGVKFGEPGYLEALKAAEPHIRKAADLSPGTGKFRMRLAQNLFEQGRKEEAWEEARKALPKIADDDGESYGFFGEVAVDREAWQEAEDPLRRAVDLQPEIRFHRERLALSLLRQGKIDEGIEVLRERFADLPSVPWSRVFAGTEAARAGRWEEAILWLSVPAEQGEIGGRAWTVKAVAHAALGQIEQAALALAQNDRLMKERKPDLPDLWHVDLPPLEEGTLENLREAYSRALSAHWDGAASRGDRSTASP
jgi:tetratricopeptide (TPR) repeat protein